MKCSKCGKKVKENWAFCLFCGAELKIAETKKAETPPAGQEPGMRCPGCGYTTEKMNKFCPKCGCSLVRAEADSEKPAVQSTVAVPADNIAAPVIEKPDTSVQGKEEAYIRCLKCGFVLKAGSEYCPQCWTPVAVVTEQKDDPSADASAQEKTEPDGEIAAAAEDDVPSAGIQETPESVDDTDVTEQDADPAGTLKAALEAIGEIADGRYGDCGISADDLIDWNRLSEFAEAAASSGLQGNEVPDSFDDLYGALAEREIAGEKATAYMAGKILALAENGEETDMELLLIAAEMNNARAQYLYADKLERQGSAESVPWYENAARNGYARAYADLGRIYCFKSDFVETDVDRGLGFWEKGVAENDAESAYRLACYLFEGDESRQDYKKGLELMKKAADAGEPYADAIEVLSGLYNEGNYGITPDLEMSEKYAWKAAEYGSGHPLNVIGDFYSMKKPLPGTDEIVEQDIGHAYRCFCKAAECGDDDGKVNMALLMIMHCEELGIERNDDKAIELIVESARRGNEFALNVIEPVYRYTDRDQAEGKRLYREIVFELAEKDVPLAYYKAYQICAGEQDVPGAVKYLQKAAETENAEAYYDLAKAYEEGSPGFVKDPEKAFGYYEKALENRNGKAAVPLSRFYITGNVAGRDTDEALRILEKGEAMGDSNAMWMLGVAYDGGFAGTDQKKAAEYYEEACENGSGRGAYLLASMYEKGSGVPEDPVKAFELYKLAADRGLDSAMVKTARAYLHGTGTETDSAAAVEYVRKAMEAGAPEKDELLKELETAPVKDDAEAVEIARALIDGGKADGNTLLFAMVHYSSLSDLAQKNEADFTKMEKLFSQRIDKYYADRDMAAYYFAKTLCYRISDDMSYDQAKDDLETAYKLLKVYISIGKSPVSLDDKEPLRTIAFLGSKYGHYAKKDRRDELYKLAYDNGLRSAAILIGEAAFAENDLKNAEKAYRDLLDHKADLSDNEKSSLLDVAYNRLYGVYNDSDNRVARFRLLKEWAEYGDPRAKGLLSLCYVEGDGTQQNYSLAKGFAIQAARELKGVDDEFSNDLIKAFDLEG